MKPSLTVLSLALLALTAPAQDLPKPAPELQRLAPLIGHWQGGGTAQMGPGEPTNWESHSTFAWALGGYFVQEDTVVRFGGMPEPLVMRSYLGWDPANRTFVSAGIDNDGNVGVNRMEMPEDGTFVTLIQRVQGGQLYFERYTTRLSGDTSKFSIDMMTAAGPSMQLVGGTMKRAGEGASTSLEGGPFASAPEPELKQLAKSAGTFDVKATMVMMPGMPEMTIAGTDVVEPVFGGNIVHVHTTGMAEGQPERYVGELFYGFDERRRGIVALYVSNMGEVGEMTGTFSDDARQFILTSSSSLMGQPLAQRMVMHMDDSGAPERASGHCLFGAAEPYESWRATYTRK
jgi:hypothetical protein